MRQNFSSVRVVVVCFLLIFSGSVVAQKTKITEGSLRVTGADGIEKGSCPLRKTEVSAEISGFISRVTVTQYFQNPFAATIEAVYKFPLPNDAAVDRMTMTVGDRVINGKIMERKQAQETYEQAKQAGKTAALLEQERANLFTQSVANITPNAEIKVVISYVETLKYADDVYEFRFPMTVGERYLPSSVSTGDAARISPKSKSRPGHTISLAVKLDAGVTVNDIFSNTHDIESAQFSASRFDVKLKSDDEIPNRDFVLKYKTAGQKLDDAILTHTDSRGGFFALILQPPDKVFPADTTPKEIVFVLDTSGSMDGFPIKKAKEALNLTLDNLNPQDTFNIITFAGATQILFPAPVPATKENLSKARKLLSDTDSGGGTEMMEAIRASLAPSDAADHIRIVCFMTDGMIGNEYEILAEIQKHPNARIFGFGIGDSVNHLLLDEMSREGRGEVEYVGLKDDGSAAARRFYERVRNPLLTDISLEFQGIAATDVYPQMIPDVFDAAPVTVVGRYSGSGSGKIILRGRMQGQIYTREIPVTLPVAAEDNDALAAIWARRKISDLTRRDYGGLQRGAMQENLQAAITDLGLNFSLLTPFTSFVAVDEQIVAPAGQPTRVEVPAALPLPEQQNNGSGAGNGNGSGSASNVVAIQSGVTATVEVTSSASLTSATSSSVSTNVTVQSIESLPVNGRSMSSLYLLAPGTTPITEVRTQLSQELISTDGQRSTSNNFTVDGLSADTGASSPGASPALTASGGTNSLATIAATSEIQVQTQSSAAEQRVGGATVNVITKSGTNAYHGSLFEIFGNEIFNANDPFAAARRLARPASRLNQFGGVLSGYIIKNKIFFFGDYEGLRLRQPAFAVTEVPTIAARTAATGELRGIYNAFPLANNIQTSPNQAEFAATFTNPAANDIFSLRVDYNPANDLSFGGRFNSAVTSAQIRGAQNYSLNTKQNLNTKTDSFFVWANYTLNTNAVIEGRANYSRNRSNQQFSLDNFGGANVGNLVSRADLTRFDFTGKNSALAFGTSSAATVRQFQANGTISIVAENHLLKLGADARFFSDEILPDNIERSVIFSGITLTPTASRVSEISRSAVRAATKNLSLFATDEWRVTSKLRVDLGLRWDADFVSGLRGAPDFSFAGATTNIPRSLRNFAPRGDVAYEFFGGKSVVRAAAGLYYDYAAGFDEYRANSFPATRGIYARDIDFNAAPNNIYRPLTLFADKLKTPRVWKFSAEFQQEIGSGSVLSARYNFALGRRLPLIRAFSNADANYNFIRLVDDEATSNYHALQLRFDRRFAKHFSLNANYTLAKSVDDYSSATFDQIIFTNNDLNRERAASDFDARHKIAVHAVYEIPTPFARGAARAFLQNWSVAAFVNARSALPINVFYRRVNDFDTEIFRPDLISGNSIGTSQNGAIFNASAFSIPVGERQGNFARNALRGFSFFQMDLNLLKKINLRGESNLLLSIQINNLLNHTNAADADGNLGTQFADGSFQPNYYFGQSNSSFGSKNFTPFYLYGGARTIQLSAKFVF